MTAPTKLATIVTALALIAAGCASADPEGGTANELPDQTTTATKIPEKPDVNERGNLEKAVGEEAGIGENGKQHQLTFTIDKVTVDVNCTAEFSEKPENGHFIALDVRVATSKDMEEFLGFGLLNPTEFSVIDEDGVTESSLDTFASYSCLPESKALPTEFAPSGKYRGTIVLDSKHKAGILVYRPAVVGGGGFEWKF